MDFCRRGGLFLMQSAWTGGFLPADEVFASGGTQQESAASEETGQPDKAGQADEEGQEDFFSLFDEEQKALLDELLKKLEDGELSTKEQIDEAISQAQEELGVTLTQEQKEQIQANISNIQAMVDELESTKDDLQAYVEQLDGNLAEIQSRISELKTLIEEKEAEIEETQQELEEAVAQ